jgi:hypothetical protein
MSSTQKALLRMTAVIAGIAAALAIPTAVSQDLPSICIFKAVSGESCPGCGTVRALHALAHFDFQLAAEMQPLIIITAPMLLFLAGRLLWRDTRILANAWRAKTSEESGNQSECILSKPPSSLRRHRLAAAVSEDAHEAPYESLDS